MLKAYFGGGTLMEDAVYMAGQFLVMSFHSGRYRVKKRDAQYRLMCKIPKGRLHIDGETHYV